MTKKILITGFAASLVFLFSCSRPKLATPTESNKDVVAEQRELIQDSIKNPEKRDRLLLILDDIEKESKTFFNYYEQHNDMLAQLLLDQTAPREDFENKMKEFNEHYEGYLRILVRKREEMRLMTSPDEWTKIMDRETSFIPK